jgi:hypothetical protein
MNTEAKTYLEEVNLNTTYWGKIIIAAESRGFFTLKDAVEASSWVTCACGRVTEDIPRQDTNRPQDYELFLNGCKFANRVGEDSFVNAAIVLSLIEKRAIVVATKFYEEQKNK